ncbi:DUF3565 domain-containing protein [Stutzerimonas azotifigens]|uniref:DUF3565 domain-containing protein n=1 Tax=Stutzerimonas azotifigens TaxID=291995 RepID=UPI000A047486|nr:DUF3565 domain-containing protein [Stutzerimonas azotifigens]
MSVTVACRECEPERRCAVDSSTGAAPHAIDFRQDDDGHWVAVLSCGHTQHLRHDPPWQSRPWVLDPAARRARLGQPFPCGWCARARPES